MLLEPPIDTLPRYRGSVAKRAWYPSIAPRCVSARSHLRWWLDSGRMRSLIDGVCIELLTRLRHNQKEPTINILTHAIRAPRAASPPCLGRTHSAR
jgi:hypothetical protein